MTQKLVSVFIAGLLSVIFLNQAWAENQNDYHPVKIIVAQSTVWNGFRPGSVWPRVISATSDCNEVEMHKMKVSTEEINGRWSHPNARGKIKISRVNNEFQVKWSGSPIQSTREVVEVSGKSLIINVDLDHSFGICNMLFRIPDVLN